MAKAPPPKPSLASRVASDPALLKRALANPGLRAKLPDKYLTVAQRQTRATNARLAQPVTPGSTMTEGDLARAAKNATTVKYAPAEQQLGQNLTDANNAKTDTGHWFDDYLKALAQHNTNVQGFQGQASQQLTDLGKGVTGLAGAESSQMNAQANADASSRGATAADTSKLQSDAAAIRQALVGSFVAQQAQTGAANNTYADTLANVVGPGQKVTALTAAGRRIQAVKDKQTALKGEEGAFNQSYRDTGRQDEVKNTLARMTLAGTQANQAASQAATTTRLQQSSPAGKAAAAAATTEAQIAAKHGYSVHDWRMLGPDGRSAKIAADKKKPADTTYTSGPFAGRTKSEVDGMPTSKRLRIVNDYNKNKGPGGKPKAGPKPATGPGSVSSAAENKAVGQVSQLSGIMTHPPRWDAGPKKGQIMTAEDVRAHQLANGADPRIVAVAYSLAKNNGKLGPDGVKQAHALGIHVNGRWDQVGNGNPNIPATKI